MSIGVAIIGGGIFAREEHLPAIQASEHLSLKAVYSRSLKSAQSLATDSAKVDLYSDDSGNGKGFEDLLKRDDIKAVVVALPILKQPQFIRAALSAGKHVLSEKPIAGTIKEAESLLQWYHKEIDSSKATWGIAENFRFLTSVTHASKTASGLGRLLHFGMKMHTLLQGGKYYETEWRKTPEYQGGFVLDGGVHFIAALRQLMTQERIKTVSAFTRKNQEHLPPIDTVDAVLRTESGATGTISISFGTTLKGDGYSVGYEKGSVTVTSDKVARIAAGKPPKRAMTVTTDLKGDTESEEIEDEGSGVKPEIRAWAESLVAGKQDPRQTPEQALADLEVLEAIFTSGSQDGQPQTLRLQKATS